MITKVKGFEEGSIYELNEISEPLYIWHDGELYKITPQEYNAAIMVDKSQAWNAVFEIRFLNQYGG